ncbi:group 1 glycosyl transferase [Chitinophagaceae bacterium IBVUCB1]|nr:group 1 glycosyl transferase [Chitinophagaceae bacterium IBVUCB1]
MMRICTTLAEAGYDVILVGFLRKDSQPLASRPYKQKRLPVVAEKGKLMYADFWLKLFFYLLFRPTDIMCCIDLDTMLPVYYASAIRRKKRVHDAHELFVELKEVITRPAISKMWNGIANRYVPRFPNGYTVGKGIVTELKKRYGVDYALVRNITVLQPVTIPEKKEKYILYQGAVNVGRRFEELIPAMQYVDAPLIICGGGNFFEETKALIQQYGLQDKVKLKGYLPPDELKQYTIGAWVGITLFEETSLSNRLSLANRFFDYMHNGVPQLCIKYEEYEQVNAEYEVASLIANPTPEGIATALNKLLQDEAYHKRLQDNCLQAREKYCWQEEAKTLLNFYEQLANK